MLVNDIVTLCKELGLEKIKISGDNVMFAYPFHGERNPSCGVSASKEIGNCFACGQHFNLVQLVSHCKEISYLDALEFLSSFFNRDFRSVSKTELRLYG